MNTYVYVPPPCRDPCHRVPVTEALHQAFSNVGDMLGTFLPLVVGIVVAMIGVRVGLRFLRMAVGEYEPFLDEDRYLPCRHELVEPVTSVMDEDEVIALLCLECDAQLPAPKRRQRRLDVSRDRRIDPGDTPTRRPEWP